MDLTEVNKNNSFTFIEKRREGNINKRVSISCPIKDKNKNKNIKKRKDRGSLFTSSIGGGYDIISNFSRRSTTFNVLQKKTDEVNKAEESLILKKKPKLVKEYFDKTKNNLINTAQKGCLLGLEILKDENTYDFTVISNSKYSILMEIDTTIIKEISSKLPKKLISLYNSKESFLLNYFNKKKIAQENINKNKKLIIDKAKNRSKLDEANAVNVNKILNEIQKENKQRILMNNNNVIDHTIIKKIEKRKNKGNLEKTLNKMSRVRFSKGITSTDSKYNETKYDEGSRININSDSKSDSKAEHKFENRFENNVDSNSNRNINHNKRSSKLKRIHNSHFSSRHSLSVVHVEKPKDIPYNHYNNMSVCQQINKVLEERKNPKNDENFKNYLENMKVNNINNKQSTTTVNFNKNNDILDKGKVDIKYSTQTLNKKKVKNSSLSVIKYRNISNNLLKSDMNIIESHNKSSSVDSDTNNDKKDVISFDSNTNIKKHSVFNMYLNKIKAKEEAKHRVHKKDKEINFSIVKLNYNKISLKNLAKETNEILNNKNTSLFSSGMFKLPCLSISINKSTNFHSSIKDEENKG